MSPSIFQYPLPNGTGWSAIGQTLNAYTYNTFGLAVLIVITVVGFLLGIQSGRRLVDGVTFGSFMFLMSSIALSILGWIGAQFITVGMGLFILSAILNYMSSSNYNLS